MQNAHTAAQYSRSGSGGGSGSGAGTGAGGGGGDLAGLYDAALASDNPANFIAQNYKQYGFQKSSGLSGGMKEYASVKDRVADIAKRSPVAAVQWLDNSSGISDALGGAIINALGLQDAKDELERMRNTVTYTSGSIYER